MYQNTKLVKLSWKFFHLSMLTKIELRWVVEQVDFGKFSSESYITSLGKNKLGIWDKWKKIDMIWAVLS